MLNRRSCPRCGDYYLHEMVSKPMVSDNGIQIMYRCGRCGEIVVDEQLREMNKVKIKKCFDQYSDDYEFYKLAYMLHYPVIIEGYSVIGKSMKENETGEFEFEEISTDKVLNKDRLKMITKSIDDFKRAKFQAEDEITQIIRKFANEYHCEIDIDIEIYNRNTIMDKSSDSFEYQAFIRATFQDT